MSIVISDKLGNSLLVNLHKSKHLGIKRQKAPALDMICRSQGTDSAISEQYRLFVADNFTEHHLDASIGVSIFPEPATSAKKLIEQVILSIQKAQRDGGRRVVVFGA